MPDRFNHLEFDEPRQQKTQQQGVLQSAPMDRHAYYDKAIQAFQRGDFEQALRFHTRTLELDKAYAPAWVGQVQMLIELDECREADLWATKALDLFRDNGDLIAARAVAKVRLGDRKMAMGLSDAAVAARGSSAWRWLGRAEVLLAMNRPQAAACFERAMQEQDADWSTRLSSARIYRRYRQYTNAMLAARASTDLAPHAPYAWYIRGLCERDLAVGGYRSSFERALELDAGYAPAGAALRERAGSSVLTRWIRRLRGR